MVQIQINADVLNWAIEDARTSPETLADKCGFSPDVIDGILDGEILPNKGQLKTISAKLGRSMQFFMLPSPPSDAISTPRFRESLHANTPDPEKEEAALRSARKAQSFVRWAGQGEQATLNSLPRAPGENAALYADRLRSHLGWSLAVQRSATSKSAVFRELRGRIENLGILVLLQGAGEKGFRGFSLPEDPAVIFVNKHYRGAALRSFTLLHELAHLGAGTGGRSCYYDSSGEERWCNEVAAEFLLPRERFLAYVRSKNVSFVTSRDTDVVRLASGYFRSSWLAVAIRLKELGYANQELVDFVRDNAVLEIDPPTAITGVDRSTPIIRREEFGTAFLTSVHRAVADSRLSELEAGRLLRSNASQLKAIWQLTSEAG